MTWLCTAQFLSCRAKESVFRHLSLHRQDSRTFEELQLRLFIFTCDHENNILEVEGELQNYLTRTCK